MRPSYRLLAVLALGTVVLTVAFAAALAYDIGLRKAPAATELAPGRSIAGGDELGGSLATPGAGGTAAGGVVGSGGGGSRGGGQSLPQVSSGAGGSAGVVAAGATILIGALITQSGPGNVTDGYRAMQAYVQYLNAHGGINGHRLALDVKDDQGNPSVGRPAFQQIVQEDKVFAVVGECAPITDAVIVGDINQDQVPVVNDCLTSKQGYSSPWIWFNFLPPDVEQAMAANFFWNNRSQLGIGRPYVVCLQQPTTTPYCDGFVNQWSQRGGTTCSQGRCNGGYDSFPIGTTRAQYETVALQIKGSGADSIVSFLEPTNQLAFLQALQDQGMSPATPHSSGGYPQYAAIGMDQFVVATVGPFCYGTMVQGFTAFPTETQFPGVALMRQVMSQYAPDVPIDSYVVAEWNPIVIFAEALRRMGSDVSRANLVATLNGMGDYSDGQQKPLGWTASNHIGPLFTRYARITGPSQFDVFTAWIDRNGNPAP